MCEFVLYKHISNDIYHGVDVQWELYYGVFVFEDHQVELFGAHPSLEFSHLKVLC